MGPVTAQTVNARRKYYKYYQVFKHNTNIIEITVNDLKPVNNRPDGELTLAPEAKEYALFTDIGRAMEKAKAGALAYIEQLIARGEEGKDELLQYRMAHYEDLNVNLLEENIQLEENAMQFDRNFTYRPYKITNQTEEP